ncbi:MAG: response regulator [Candidatus Paceibacterota bacterium]|jgi:two-component system chemotaxis response regulator CheY
MDAKKILIVEDEAMFRHAIVEKFSEDKHFIVMSAKNGKEGLDAALREHPDCILLDIIMPVMDGVEMLALLRDDPWGKDVEVVCLSNIADSDRMAEARAKGVHEFIVKSDTDIKEFVKKIENKFFQEKEAA